MSALGRRLTSKTPRRWRLLKKRFPRPRGGNPQGARARHIGRSLVPGRDARWPEEQDSPIAGPGRVHVREPITINAPNRPICSVRYAPNAELGQPSCCLPATPKPCSFTSTRSQPKVAPNAHAILLLDQAGWHGAKDSQSSARISRSCRCRRARPNSTRKKTSGSSCVRTGSRTASFKSFDDILDHCCYAWNTLIDQPWKILAIARRDWADVGQTM